VADIDNGLQLRSTVNRDGTLEIALITVPTPELCLRLQRGSGIRRWALRAAGRGTRGGGAQGEGR
jgi:hypothetical protein